MMKQPQPTAEQADAERSAMRAVFRVLIERRQARLAAQQTSEQSLPRAAVRNN